MFHIVSCPTLDVWSAVMSSFDGILRMKPILGHTSSCVMDVHKGSLADIYVSTQISFTLSHSISRIGTEVSVTSCV